MTATVNKLEEVMRAELELTCSLITVLEEQQQAIAHLRMSALDNLVAREYQILAPMQELERERARIIASIVQGTPDAEKESLRSVLPLLGEADAKRIESLGIRLRQEVDQVLTLNRRIKILLKQSLRFVKESVGILTEGFSRQLVDEKV